MRRVEVCKHGVVHDGWERMLYTNADNEPCAVVEKDDGYCITCFIVDGYAYKNTPEPTPGPSDDEIWASAYRSAITGLLASPRDPIMEIKWLAGAHADDAVDRYRSRQRDRAELEPDLAVVPESEVRVKRRQRDGWKWTEAGYVDKFGNHYDSAGTFLPTTPGGKPKTMTVRHDTKEPTDG